MKFLADLLDGLLGNSFSVRDEPDLSPVAEAISILEVVDPHIAHMRRQVDDNGTSDWLPIDSFGLREVRLVKYGPVEARMPNIALECRTLRGTLFDHLCVSWSNLIRNYTPEPGASCYGPSPADLKGSTSTLLGLFPQIEEQEHMSYREAKVGQLVSKPTGSIKWSFLFDCSVT